MVAGDGEIKPYVTEENLDEEGNPVGAPAAP